MIVSGKQCLWHIKAKKMHSSVNNVHRCLLCEWSHWRQRIRDDKTGRVTGTYTYSVVWMIFVAWRVGNVVITCIDHGLWRGEQIVFKLFPWSHYHSFRENPFETLWIRETFLVNDESESEGLSVMSDSLQPHGKSPWNSPWNTGVGSLSLLQRIFPTQG